MPVKTGTKDTGDYQKCKEAADTLKVGENITLSVDHFKRCQKYIYEIGLKHDPKRKFTTRKNGETVITIYRYQ